MRSMPAFRKKAQFEFAPEKYQSPAGILLNSRTVVEKNDYVSTGVLSYAEGDILEVELNNYNVFELGDSVKLTVYSPGGIYMFGSTVVAKDHGALMFINPPSNQKRFAEKRDHPRVPVSQEGRIRSLISPEPSAGGLHEDIMLNIENISVSGLGFTVGHEVQLDPQMRIEIEMDLGMPIPCIAEIIRKEPSQGGVYYGAKYVELSGDKANSLRAFVLKKQVETHFSKKKEAQAKRMFK
ncbi:PilZ domain-containing protein [Paenibacillus hamazuiensis]|uniref:PilZ domain-containing protein n=1 Tax=Paenibacillus hamazuiensis TaxID=2936508 RepID=UPI00200BA4E6|nr:PilZ domain-containing protein [Paenibacillus hamazuiensis]